jgi:hypothetical protein
MNLILLRKIATKIKCMEDYKNFCLMSFTSFSLFHSKFLLLNFIDCENHWYDKKRYDIVEHLINRDILMKNANFTYRVLKQNDEKFFNILYEKNRLRECKSMMIHLCLSNENLNILKKIFFLECDNKYCRFPTYNTNYYDTISCKKYIYEDLVMSFKTVKSEEIKTFLIENINKIYE